MTKLTEKETEANPKAKRAPISGGMSPRKADIRNTVALGVNPQAEANPEKFVSIEISRLKEPKYGLRRNMEEPDPKFVESIKEGVIEPLIVRELDNSSYEIVCGTRRFRAAKEANIKKLPCVIKALSDLDAATMSYSENEQRKGVAAAGKAAFFASLIKEERLKQKDLAERFRLKEGTLSKYLAVHGDPLLESMVTNGEIAFSSAIELLSKKNEAENKLSRKLGDAEWQSFVNERKDLSEREIREGITQQEKIRNDKKTKCYDCGKEFPVLSMKNVKVCTSCHAKRLKERKTANKTLATI